MMLQTASLALITAYIHHQSANLSCQSPKQSTNNTPMFQQIISSQTQSLHTKFKASIALNKNTHNEVKNS
jgi:hypothetical protein